MPYQLPPLPYAFDALEPHIDAKTMEIHHDKHHATYVNKLNEALANHPDLQAKSLEDLLRDVEAVPESIRGAVRNHGGGHSNHSVFWEIMGPGGGGNPSGPLAQAIDEAFTNFDNFKQQMTNAAASLFGSGWAWLVLTNGTKLDLITRPNQNSPLMEGKVPLVGVDVWEHAYYLKYQNRRPDYLSAWWNTINWQAVAQRYSAARG
jgi:Fe-Mn family superoxide dismutase